MDFEGGGGGGGEGERECMKKKLTSKKGIALIFQAGGVGSMYKVMHKILLVPPPL